MSRRDEILTALANGAMTEAELGKKISAGIFKGELHRLVVQGIVTEYGEPPTYSLAPDGNE